MSPRPTRCRARRAIVGVLLAVGLLAGCGGSPPPAHQVPALTATLGRVDAALVHGRYDEARAELKAVISTTRTARDAERITDAQAQAIIAAATEVLDALPGSAPAPTPSPSSSPTSASPAVDPTRPRAPGRGNGNGKGNGKGNGNGRGHGNG